MNSCEVINIELATNLTDESTSQSSKYFFKSVFHSVLAEQSFYHKVKTMENTSKENIGTVNFLALETNPISRPEGVAWCIVFSLLSVFIVVGNLLTVTLFAVNKRVRKKSLFFVINMASADLMLGTLGLPTYAIRLLLTSTEYYLLSTRKMNWTLIYVCNSSITLSCFVSHISACLISCERFYAIHFPFKHRTKTAKGYNTLIFLAWTLALLGSFGFATQSFKSFSFYFSLSCATVSTVIICGCNFAIWIKFKHENVASTQQNREAQNIRLTKTLMFVSILTLLSWLPLIVVNFSRGEIVVRYVIIAVFINSCNSFINPVLYALRIPEFRRVLALCCIKRRVEMNETNFAVQSNKAAIFKGEKTLRTIHTDSSNLHRECNESVMDTKL